MINIQKLKNPEDFYVAAEASHQAQGQDTEMNPYVEPAHDALVRGWQKLLKWK